MSRKLFIPGFLVASALSFAAAPSNQVAASECGGPGGSLCKENESCVSIIFFRSCTKRYDYWNDL